MAHTSPPDSLALAAAYGATPAELAELLARVPAAELFALFDLAAQELQGAAAARRWLTTPAPVFAFVTPRDLLCTYGGLAAVRAELARLQR